MRDLNIAYGNSCMAKKWSNKTITFGELCGRLENTIRTTDVSFHVECKVGQPRPLIDP